MRNRGAFVTGLLLAILVASPARADAIHWTLATALPENSKMQARLAREARRLARKTDGRVRIDVTGVDAPSVGGSMRVLSREEHFDAALVPAFEYAELVPEAAVYGQPFLFEGMAEVRATRERFDAGFIEAIQHQDYVVLGAIGVGFSYLMSDRAFSEMAEIEGAAVKVPFEEAAILQMLSSLSLRPRHDAEVADVALTLNSPSALILDKRVPRPGYLVLPPVQYGYMFFVVRRSRWQELLPEERQMVDEFFAALIRELDDKARNISARAIRLLQKKGMRILSLPEEDVSRLRRSAAVVPPGNPLQERLAEAVEEVRGLANTPDAR